MPGNIGELVWYGFGLLATYFLYSINWRLGVMDKKLTTEQTQREALALEVAAMKSRCEERHRGN